MKSELDLMRELKLDFEHSFTSADNILAQEKVAPVNVNWFTKQKDWSGRLADRFGNIYDSLKKEKIEDRILRSLGNEERVEIFNRVISALETRRDELIQYHAEIEKLKLAKEEARKLAEEEDKLKAEQVPVKKVKKKSTENLN